MCDILTNISLLLTFFDLFLAMFGNGMLESMLEPHLKAYGAGTSGVGMTFTIFGICYVLGNLLFERVSIIKSGPSILILSKLFHLDNDGRHVHCSPPITYGNGALAMFTF